jgi:hypothetical protein
MDAGEVGLDFRCSRFATLSPPKPNAQSVAHRPFLRFLAAHSFSLPSYPWDPRQSGDLVYRCSKELSDSTGLCRRLLTLDVDAPCILSITHRAAFQVFATDPGVQTTKHHLASIILTKRSSLQQLAPASLARLPFRTA